jgi:hypothetical protein
VSNDQTAAAAARPIATGAEALEAIRQLDGVVDAIDQIIEQEGMLVRAGRLVEVAQLAARKDEFARRYLADTQRLKASLPRLRGELGQRLDAVKARHGAFLERLQRSLTVLATAHAVSEGIMRGLSQELTRKAAPQVYGASGRPTPARSGYATPLAVSRTL